MEDIALLDPTASLVELGKPNAKVVPDESGLHQKVVFLGDEKARITEYLFRHLTKTIDDYAPVWNKRAENLKAYEALAEKEAITLPMSRAQVNQQHAWLLDRVFSGDPIVSIRALGDDVLEIITVDPTTQAATVDKVSLTKFAEGIQDLLQYKWTVRLPMRKVLSDWLMEALNDGTVPAVVKIIHDEQKRRIMQRAAPSMLKDPVTGEPKRTPDGRQIQIQNAPEFRTVIDGEAVQILNVPGEKFLVPFGQTDLQRAPWIAMETNPQAADVRRNIASGEWDFANDIGEQPTEQDIDAVLFAYEDTTDKPNRAGKRVVSRVDKRTSFNPLTEHTVYEVFLRWPLMTDEKPDVITWEEIVVPFHLKAKQVLTAWVLDSWNGKRQFVDFFMRQRPNSYSGTCTNEDVAPFQRYASNLFHLQVQNMVMRNISVIMVRKGTSTATFLKKKSNIRPGMVLDVDDLDDVKLTPLGTPIESIANEISFLKAGAVEMGLSTQYDTATANLSRVAADAFAQQQDLSKMQPKQVYSTFAERIGVLALMYIQALIQYAPDQVLPKFDPEKDAIINHVLNLPREMITDQFQFVVTATAADQTPEAQFQQDTALQKDILEANNFAMSTLGQIMVPTCPPEFQKLGVFFINRNELVLAQKLRAAKRHNVSEMVMSPKMIADAIEMLNQRMQQQQAAAANQPDEPEMPHVSISLSGQIDPVTIAALVGQLGLPATGLPITPAGGANAAALSDAGSGGPVPAGQSQPAGLRGVPQFEGGEGMGAPPPSGGIPPQPAGQ